MVSVGNIYAIPSGEKFAIAKIIYLSNFFKDVIQIRFFERSSKIPKLPVDDLNLVNSRLIFTGLDSIKRGGWILIGNEAVSENEQLLSRRIVGGDVWIADDHLGPASDAELEALPQMDVYGYKLIEKAVSQLN